MSGTNTPATTDVCPSQDQQTEAGIKLPTEVVQKLRIYQLEQQNLQFQLQIMHGDLQKLTDAKQKLRETVEEFRKEVKTCYGIDFMSHQILPDGTVLVPPSPGFGA